MRREDKRAASEARESVARLDRMRRRARLDGAPFWVWAVLSAQIQIVQAGAARRRARDEKTRRPFDLCVAEAERMQVALLNEAFDDLGTAGVRDTLRRFGVELK